MSPCRPLSESKVLKKKFDAIFDASKYSKALENVKEIMKQQVRMHVCTYVHTVCTAYGYVRMYISVHTYCFCTYVCKYGHTYVHTYVTVFLHMYINHLKMDKRCRDDKLSIIKNHWNKVNCLLHRVEQA